ncbi:unnamed protein product [Cuscuta europaea]|uniref:HVA22-like protein n=1 Tax=Cuscuta europaea TaxID=41803 RepID=A0A9P1EMT2_CUSEU|nr:unnamed protein product [Cuscuta europaea]
MGSLTIIARNLHSVVGPGVTLLFPLFSSMRAIESPSTLDDQQWLTYWILYSFITLFELSSWKVLQWLPFWAFTKLLFCMWLVLPNFNGAAYIYEKYVRRYVKVDAKLNSNFPERREKAMEMMSPEAQKYVKDYIVRNGQEAFDEVIKMALLEARRKERVKK